jgi:acetyl-CoA acetyltransferase
MGSVGIRPAWPHRLIPASTQPRDNALGIHELRFSNMHWGGGGGGVAAAVANAGAAVHAGMAHCVIAFRSLAQGQFARYGRGAQAAAASGDDAFLAPYGLMSPAQRFAMKITRFMTEHGIRHEALRAIALTSYFHAQTNPRAVMRGRPLDAAKYEDSRWIIEPFHRLFDCCMENDGAAAVLVVPAESARDMPHRLAYLLGAAQGGHHRSAAPVHNAPDYASAHFPTVARNLWSMAQLGPRDVDVLQAYENFTGGVLLGMVEHGMVSAEEANEFMVPENLRFDTGRLPLNTSGGNLAECYMHGLEMVNEAVRQLRGTAPNQVRDPKVAMVIGGPMVTPVSSLILGTEETL